MIILSNTLEVTYHTKDSKWIEYLCNLLLIILFLICICSNYLANNLKISGTKDRVNRSISYYIIRKVLIKPTECIIEEL